MHQSINIFDFTDHRLFLRAYYDEQKSRNPAFSYRYFALKAGIRSPGYYKDIIDGRKKMSTPAIRKFAQTMHLTLHESEYFENMVRFSDAPTAVRARPFLDRMQSLSPCQAHTLEPALFQYYDCWYYSAIRALVSYRTISGDPAEVARMLVPPISTEQAASALDVLEKLGLITRDTQGIFRQTSALISSGVQSA